MDKLNLKFLMNKGFLVLFLIWSFAVGSAMLYKPVSVVYYIIAFLGGYYWFIKKDQLYFPSYVKFWLFLGLIVFLYVFLSIIIFSESDLLFKYRFEVFRDLIWLPFLWVAIYQVRWNKQLLFKLITLIACYALVYDVLLYVESPARGDGLLQTPISRGNMGMLWGLLSLIAFYGLEEKKWKVLAIVGFFSGVGLSLLSGSRGGWGALFISFLFLIFYFYFFQKRYFWGLVSVVLVFALVLYGFWDYLPVKHRIDQTISSLYAYSNGNPHTSLGYRFEMWKAAWMAFLEKPLFGWGFGGFDQFFLKYLHEGLVKGSPSGWGHAHNDYLFILSELGIVGFILFFSFVLYPFVKVFYLVKRAIHEQEKNLLMLGLLGVILTEALCEFALSDQTFTVKYFMFVYVLFYMIIFAVFEKNHNKL